MGVGLVALVVGAYWIKVRPAPPAQLGTVNASEDATMKAGLDALYGKKDPSTAAVQFRKLRDRNPSHYGAMAEGYKDTQTSYRAELERRRWGGRGGRLGEHLL